MGDDGDDGYNPSEMKLKSGAKGVADVLDQVDKDTEEVLNEFNFLSGSAGTNVSDPDSVDSAKGGSAGTNDDSAEWGKQMG